MLPKKVFAIVEKYAKKENIPWSSLRISKVKKVDSHSAGLSGEEIAKMLDAEDHDIRLDLSDSAWRHIKEELK